MRAAAILREDLAYLETLELPLARRSAEQRRIHAENLELIAATEGTVATGRAPAPENVAAAGGESAAEEA